MKTFIRKSAAACLMAAVAGWSCAGFAQTKPVTVSINATIGLYWPNFVADKHGFVTKEQVRYETIVVGDAAQQVQQLIGGSIDIAYSNCELALKAIDKGANITIIGQLLHAYPFTVMSAADVKSAQDLRGKKVILSFKNSFLTLFWNRWVRDQGMKPEEIDQVFDGATPNRYSALRNGVVAAAAVSQPFDFRAKAEGFNRLMSYATYMGEYAFTCAIARKDWAKQNADTLRAYLRGMSNAIEWLYDPANKEAAVDLLAEVSKQPRPLVAETYDYYFGEIKPFTRKMAIGPVGMQKLLDALKENKDVRPHWKVEDFIDRSYLPV